MLDEQFKLGTHRPYWLWTEGRGDFPVFVSDVQLARYKNLYPAVRDWALDSGAFTALQRLGEQQRSTVEYAKVVRRYHDEIGRLDWAAPQDWMCEPPVRLGGWWGKGRRRQYFAGTHKSVTEHQQLTLRNGLDLRMLDSDLPWRWVLQGWDRDDYLRHWDMHERAGIDLEREPLVGLGSVCRRQSTGEADWIVRSLAPLRLHGFGVKTDGLLRFGHRLTGCDSMAWSDVARWEYIRLPGCTHKTCSNCHLWAALWRGRLLDQLARRQWIQGDLFDPDENWIGENA